MVAAKKTTTKLSPAGRSYINFYELRVTEFYFLYKICPKSLWTILNLCNSVIKRGTQIFF